MKNTFFVLVALFCTPLFSYGASSPDEIKINSMKTLLKELSKLACEEDESGESWNRCRIIPFVNCDEEEEVFRNAANAYKKKLKTVNADIEQSMPECMSAEDKERLKKLRDIFKKCIKIVPDQWATEEKQLASLMEIIKGSCDGTLSEDQLKKLRDSWDESVE